MTEIRHHLTDSVLMAYSAGSLPEAHSLVVASHVSLCDECRARLAEFDVLGGQVLESVGAAELDEAAFDATLARIGDGEGAEAPAAAPAKRMVASGQPSGARPVFPAPLRDWVGGDLDSVRWRPVGGGVSQCLVETSGHETVRLLRIPGGVAVPDHSHGGLELTLVLQGAFSDETDRFAAGDVEVADDDLTHAPVAEPGPDCICLAATESRLQFKGLIPRLAGRVMGI